MAAQMLGASHSWGVSVSILLLATEINGMKPRGDSSQGKVMSRKIFFFTTFKLCDNNGYLSTQIYNFFVQNGHEMVNMPELADFIVISTCGFDQERENISFSTIDSYIRKFVGKKGIIICGCLPKINPDLFDLSQVILIGPRELNRFNEIFEPAVRIENISGSWLNGNFINEHYGFLDAYYLQICQGCVNDCSYCAIKKAKGEVTSKPIDKIISELKEGMRVGFKRFVLLADDCGSYGLDLDVDFAKLLNQLKEFDIRVNINYIEPRELQLLYPKIDQGALEKIDFMDIPLQSTSNRILRLMNRRYEGADILKIAKEIKRRSPHIYLETQIIYGFPSETREEFRDTFRLTEFFDTVIYFYYTDRKNVKSSFLPGKLSSSEVTYRTEEIMRHPRYAPTPDKAEFPMVLSGYGMDKSDIFKSIERNCSCNRD
jgi:MiaB/RimO family radical SAM methylthiotransferase